MFAFSTILELRFCECCHPCIMGKAIAFNKSSKQEAQVKAFKEIFKLLLSLINSLVLKLTVFKPFHLQISFIFLLV